MALRRAEGGQKYKPECASIVVLDRRALIRDCLVHGLRSMNPHQAVLSFATVAEWLEAAEQCPPPTVIVLNLEGQTSAQTERDLTLLAQNGGAAIPIIVVSDLDDAEHVLLALNKGVRGYIPTNVTLEIAVQAIRLVQVGGTYVPGPSILAAAQSARSSSVARMDVHSLLTARQAAVVEAVRQGKPNKRIAYELNMHESTVKVHLRNIMKKLKAKNRTEVAVLMNSPPAAPEA